MFYTTLTIKDKEYKCRLNAKACVDLEKRLRTNPLNIFTRVASNGEVPPLEVLLQILHASLQTMEHGITLEKTYDLYDAYVEDGHTMVDLIPFILEIFKTSGFFVEDSDGKN